MCYSNSSFSLPYGIGSSLSRNRIENEGYGCYEDVYFLMNKKPKKLPYTIREKGNYLCAYYVGSYYDVYKRYDEMIKYAYKNNIKLSNTVYEDGLLDEVAVIGDEQYVLRICIKVIN